MDIDIGAANDLPKSQTHVWRIHLDQGAPPHAVTWLSPAEVARARRFAFERDHRRFVAAHAGLRSVLSHYLGHPPGDLDLAETSTGKPVLSSGRLAFNLSHSQELALVAVAREGHVGVDIEHLAPLEDEMALAVGQFAPAEVAMLREAAAGERLTLFYRLWTCREALLKAAGVGLTGIGAEVALDGEGTAYVARRPSALPEPVSLIEFKPAEHYTAAVVWTGVSANTRARHFDSAALPTAQFANRVSAAPELVPSRS